VTSPAPLDPELVQRVLRRASEFTPAHPDVPALGHRIDEAVLIDAAAEVGIPEEAVRRALAWERLPEAPHRRALDALAGPAQVVTGREVPATVDVALGRLDDLLVKGHHLRRERSRADAGEWRRREDWAGSVMRQIRGLGGEGRLGTAEAVTGRAVAAGAGACVVQVDVDRGGARSTRLAAAGITTGAGVAVGAAIALTATPIGWVLVPLAGWGGWWVARTGRRQAQRTRRELERLLDAVEEGRRPRSLVHDVAHRRPR
jgi:hypothetical protein